VVGSPAQASLHVCFVCTGNICRSPTAALVFGEQLRRAGFDGQVRVTSAGTQPWHVGQPIDRRAGQLLARNGYPTSHVAAHLDGDHLASDLLLAMASGHEKALRGMVDDPTRDRLLRSFDPTATGDLDVPDPYYDGAQGFADVLVMIESAMPGLLDWVRERL
jgi:protein-tyrosine phosphatase